MSSNLLRHEKGEECENAKLLLFFNVVSAQLFPTPLNEGMDQKTIQFCHCLYTCHSEDAAEIFLLCLEGHNRSFRQIQ